MLPLLDLELPLTSLELRPGTSLCGPESKNNILLVESGFVDTQVTPKEKLLDIKF